MSIDVAVIGGGAAGIAAARTLVAKGKSVLLVEARGRLGGRGHTIYCSGMPLDLGCGWLHSAQRNPWRRVAEEAGFAVEHTRPAWGAQWRELGFSQADREAAGAAYEAFETRLRENPPSSDRALDAIDPSDRWYGFIEALSGYINGAGLADLSIADYLTYDDAASENNWRVPDGYGTLIASTAKGVPIALACPVERVDTSGRGVRLETARGTIEADKAIVTIPTNVLARGRLKLPPAFDAQVHAATQLPLGLANKLFLMVDGPEDLDADSHLLGNPRAAETGSYYIRPFGRPVIECFFGGVGARELEAEGFNGSADFAIDELSALLGSDWRKRLKLVTGSAWGRDDFALGSYSHACPGHASARQVLASSPDERIAFAGEACSRSDFSTAHGAYLTGVAAAEALLS